MRNFSLTMSPLFFTRHSSALFAMRRNSSSVFISRGINNPHKSIVERNNMRYYLRLDINFAKMGGIAWPLAFVNLLWRPILALSIEENFQISIREAICPWLTRSKRKSRRRIFYIILSAGNVARVMILMLKNVVSAILTIFASRSEKPRRNKQ